MPYARLIAEAWRIAVATPKLKWFVFVPNLALVTLFVLRVGWQIYAYGSEFGTLEGESGYKSFWALLAFLSDKGLLWPVVVAIGLSFALQFMVMPLVEGATYAAINAKVEQPIRRLSLRASLLTGARYFFRFFELKGVLALFSLYSLLLYTGTFYRFFHDSLWGVIKPILLIHFALSLVVNFFLQFAQHAVVYEDEGLSGAIKRSVSLVFLHLGPVLGTNLLMALVHLRVLLNVLVVFGLPVVVGGIFSVLSQTLALVVGGAVAVLTLSLTAYLTAVLDVFTTAVWIKVYHYLKKRQAVLMKADG